MKEEELWKDYIPDEVVHAGVGLHCVKSSEKAKENFPTESSDEDIEKSLNVKNGPILPVFLIYLMVYGSIPVFIWIVLEITWAFLGDEMRPLLQQIANALGYTIIW